MEDLESPIARQSKDQAGKSNDLLTGHEQRIVRDLLNAAEKKLASLELEIQHTPTQSDSANLLEQHRQELDCIARFRIALSPHKALPPEILATIFVLCVGVVELRLAFKLPMSWTLSHVCSRWRQVAFDERRLWNNVTVSFGDWTKPLRLAHLASDCLSRGGAYLSLACSGNPESDKPWEELENPLANLVLPHAERIQNLSLSAPVHWIKSGLGTTPLSLGMLKKLKFTFLRSQRSSSSPIPVPEEPFSAAPELREVIIQGAYGWWPTFSISGPPHLPWAQLSTLSLLFVNISIHDTLTLLRPCANLVKMTLSVAAPHPRFPSFPDATTGVHLPQLKSLILSIDYTFKHFLTQLTLPALDHCVFRGRNRLAGHWPRDEFLALIKRTQCSLRWLEIYVDIPSSELAPLFENVPYLTHLTIPHQISPFPDMVLKRMASWDLLPHLQYIHARITKPIAFADMLEYRWPIAQAPYPSMEFVRIMTSGAHPNDEEELHKRLLKLSRARASAIPTMKAIRGYSHRREFSLASDKCHDPAFTRMRQI